MNLSTSTASADAPRGRYIEEHHEYKTANKADQQRRFSRPGGPPQNLAMYWV